METAQYLRVHLDTPPVIQGRGIGARANYRYEYKGNRPCVLEVCCVTQGVLHHRSGGITRTYPENSVALVHWENPISAWSDSPMYAESYVALLFSEPPETMTAEQVLARDPMAGDAVVPRLVDDEKTVRLLTALVNRLIRRTRDRSAPAQGLDIRAGILEIFSRLTEYSVNRARRQEKPSEEKGFLLCQAACSYVAEHLNERITVAEVAAHLGISTRYLCGLFSKHMGVSPIQYINREKIAAVAELLHSRGMTLEAAGRSLGFEDARYLRALFRRCTGMTATEYKAQGKMFRKP